MFMQETCNKSQHAKHLNNTLVLAGLSQMAMMMMMMMMMTMTMTMMTMVTMMTMMMTMMVLMMMMMTMMMCPTNPPAPFLQREEVSAFSRNLSLFRAGQRVDSGCHLQDQLFIQANPL